jgi:hypothetical protein
LPKTLIQQLAWKIFLNKKSNTNHVNSFFFVFVAKNEFKSPFQKLSTAYLRWNFVFFFHFSNFENLVKFNLQNWENYLSYPQKKEKSKMFPISLSKNGKILP